MDWVGEIWGIDCKEGDTVRTDEGIRGKGGMVMRGGRGC